MDIYYLKNVIDIIQNNKNKQQITIHYLPKYRDKQQKRMLPQNNKQQFPIPITFPRQLPQHLQVSSPHSPSPPSAYFVPIRYKSADCSPIKNDNGYQIIERHKEEDKGIYLETENYNRKSNGKQFVELVNRLDQICQWVNNQQSIQDKILNKYHQGKGRNGNQSGFEIQDYFNYTLNQYNQLQIYSLQLSKLTSKLINSFQGYIQKIELQPQRSQSDFSSRLPCQNCLDKSFLHDQLSFLTSQLQSKQQQLFKMEHTLQQINRQYRQKFYQKQYEKYQLENYYTDIIQGLKEEIYNGNVREKAMERMVQKLQKMGGIQKKQTQNRERRETERSQIQRGQYVKRIQELEKGNLELEKELAKLQRRLHQLQMKKRKDEEIMQNQKIYREKFQLIKQPINFLKLSYENTNNSTNPSGVGLQANLQTKFNSPSRQNQTLKILKISKSAQKLKPKLQKFQQKIKQDCMNPSPNFLTNSKNKDKKQQYYQNLFGINDSQHLFKIKRMKSLNNRNSQNFDAFQDPHHFQQTQKQDEYERDPSYNNKASNEKWQCLHTHAYAEIQDTQVSQRNKIYMDDCSQSKQAQFKTNQQKQLFQVRSISKFSEISETVSKRQSVNGLVYTGFQGNFNGKLLKDNNQQQQKQLVNQKQLVKNLFVEQGLKKLKQTPLPKLQSEYNQNKLKDRILFQKTNSNFHIPQKTEKFQFYQQKLTKNQNSNTNLQKSFSKQKKNSTPQQSNFSKKPPKNLDSPVPSPKKNLSLSTVVIPQSFSLSAMNSSQSFHNPILCSNRLHNFILSLVQRRTRKSKKAQQNQQDLNRYDYVKQNGQLKTGKYLSQSFIQMPTSYCSIQPSPKKQKNNLVFAQPSKNIPSHKRSNTSLLVQRVIQKQKKKQTHPKYKQKSFLGSLHCMIIHNRIKK